MCKMGLLIPFFKYFFQPRGSELEVNFDLAKVFFLCCKLLYLVLTISRKHKKSISQAVSTYHQNFRENAKFKAPLIVFLTFPLPDSWRPCSCACVKSIFSSSRCLLILGFSRYSLYIYCESFTKTRGSVDKVIYIYEYSGKRNSIGKS